VRTTVTNTKAAWALATGLVALAVFGAAAGSARYYDEVRLVDAVVAVPLALAFGIASVVLGHRARTEHQRTLGRSGNRSFIALARVVGTLGLLLGLTAALALTVFAVLVLVLE
jgi:hypothetical protein